MEAQQLPPPDEGKRRQHVAELVEELSRLTWEPNQQQTALRV